jgi:hypothetical protein
MLAIMALCRLVRLKDLVAGSGFDFIDRGTHERHSLGPVFRNDDP